MASVGKVVGIGVVVVILVGAGYLTADAYDLVPGGLTLAPPDPSPSAFPTVPALAAAQAPATPALADLDPHAPVPAAAVIQHQIDALVAEPVLGSSIGVLVVDRMTGDVLGSHLPDAARTPASTAKLLTATAALGSLDPQATLPTQVVAGASEHQIVLVGGGDMMLAAGAGNPGAVDGHAGLGDLAAQVAQSLELRGTTSVQLRLDDTLFSGPSVNPGWDPTDVNYGYVAPIASLAVNSGRTTNAEYAPRYSDPAMVAAKTFARDLAADGITVTGSPVRGTAPSGASVLGEVRSAPLADVVGYALTNSDNTIAEVIGRLVAIGQDLPASFDGATQGVLHVIGTMGITVTGDHLSDCSGLSDGSAVTPRTLVTAVEVIQGGKYPALREVAAGLPIGGLTGTLANRFTGNPASGQVRAKTGSLSGVTSLAGTVVTVDGRQLAFAVMADTTGAPTQDGPRKAIDAFIAGLAGCGCQ